MPEVNYMPNPASAYVQFVPDLPANGTVTHGAYYDPNGNVTGSPGDIYKSAISLGGDGTLWTKASGTNTNTGWE